MGPNLEHVCRASIPLTALPALAALRRETGIQISLTAGRAWVRWEAGSEKVLRQLLPVPGVELFVLRGGRWYRPGRYLPEFGLPSDREDDAMSLARALVPEPVHLTASVAPKHAPARLVLVREERPRPPSALECGLDVLACWAESATSAELAVVRAARAADRVLLLGSHLPPLAGGERFWGGRILVPIGFRTDPELAEPALRSALQVAADEILIVREGGVERIAESVFQGLTRAGVRLALGAGA